MADARRELIFYDSEFSTLDPYKGEILSIGMVRQDGSQLYIELEYDGPYSDWVKTNLLSTLTGEKLSREEARRQVTEFVGPTKPTMVANVNCFDAVYLYKLFAPDEIPFHWIPIDFASVLFGRGLDAEAYSGENKKPFVEKLGLDPAKYVLHHALDDARLLRDVYNALMLK